MKVAVVGSGLAGLSAAWLLSNDSHFSNGKAYEVHLIERAASLGMDSASVEVLDGKARVDVPMRGFSPGYYPTLVRIYHLLGIQFQRRNHEIIFCRRNENGGTKPFFSYQNHLRQYLGFGVPIPDFHGSKISEITRLTYDWARFFYRSHQYARMAELGKGHLIVDEKITIHEYLKRNHYSDGFIFDSLYAMMTAVCTCPYEDCKTYPAYLILGFYGSGLIFEGASAVSNGVKEVCKVMSQSVSKVHLSRNVVSVEPFDDKGTPRVKLTDSTGKVEIFDYVVLASQANQALNMLKNPTEEEKKALSSWKYVKARVCVHTDNRVMADDRNAWRGINMVSSSEMTATMTTMYMNQIMPNLSKERDIFQTVFPAIEINKESIISETIFERCVVDTNAVDGLRLLKWIQGKRHVFFVGAYAHDGIPLLEGCVCSGLNVAESLGADLNLIFKNEQDFRKNRKNGQIHTIKENGQFGIRTYRDTYASKLVALFLFLFSWLFDLIF